METEFGIHLALNQVGEPAPERLAYYGECLRAGEGALTALWISDHLQNEASPIPEGWTALTYIAAQAPAYRVGNLVLSQSYRNPALLAKMAATLQWLTDGRVVLGIGAGWQEEEYRSYGYPFPSAAQRIEELGEAIDVIRALWKDSPATYRGKYYRIEDAYCEPHPSPSPPILVGGQGPRLMRLVAEKADAWHWDGPLEMFRPPYERLVRSCAEVGRDLAEIKLVAGVEVYLPKDRADFPEPYWSGYLDFWTTPLGPTSADAVAEIDRLVEIGVSEFTAYFWDLDSLKAFVDEVVPRFR